MTPQVIALAGRIGSGKSRVSRELAQRLGWLLASFGAYVREEAARRGLDLHSRQVLQDIGEELIVNGLREFCRNVLAASGWEPGVPLVVDGIRQLAALRELAGIVSPMPVTLVFLDVPDKIRRQRLRDRGDEASASELVEWHSTEVEVRSALRERADLLIDGSQASAQVVEEILARLSRVSAGSRTRSGASQVPPATGESDTVDASAKLARAADLLTGVSHPLALEQVAKICSAIGSRGHVAILTQPYLDRILQGTKTIESRLTKIRCAPFRRVGSGDILFLKEAGGRIRGIAVVSHAESAGPLTPQALNELIQSHIGALHLDAAFRTERRDSKFATLVHLACARQVTPIAFLKSDRRGWLVVPKLTWLPEARALRENVASLTVDPPTQLALGLQPV